MNVRRGNECVQLGFFRVFYCIPCLVNVILVGTAQTCHFAAFQFCRNFGNRIKIAFRSSGKPGFQHIHAQFFQLGCQTQFFIGVHARAGGLLAVS